MEQEAHFVFAFAFLLRRAAAGKEPRVKSWAERHPALASKIAYRPEDLPAALLPVARLYHGDVRSDSAAANCRGIVARYYRAMANNAYVGEPETPAVLQTKQSWSEDHGLVKALVAPIAMEYRARWYVYSLACQLVNPYADSLL